MYWPIGIPKYYASSRNSTARHENQSDDGLEAKHSNEAGNGTSNGQESNEGAAPDPSRPGIAAKKKDSTILDIKSSRNGHLFATVTRKTLSIWQSKPTVLLATVVRSEQSLKVYGHNVALLMRADALIIVVQTQLGFLITYSLASDPNARVYQLQIISAGGGHVRRQSADAFRRPSIAAEYGASDGGSIKDINIRFRMVIRIDAGISKALALDDELVVATTKPSAIQCIRWSPDSSGGSHTTDTLKRMTWAAEKTTVLDMVYDRPMNLHIWIAHDGRVYAAQRTASSKADGRAAASLFRGHCFHTPANEDENGVKASINARFSLIAIGCADSSVRIFTAKDYLGNVPLSNLLRLPVSTNSSGRLTFLSYSPDGYCLFAGFEKGWATWSVYGKAGANSFSSDQASSVANDEWWLRGIADGFWSGGGSEIILLELGSDRICSLDMARSSAATCFNMSNISRPILQTSTSIMLYKGMDIADVTAIPGDSALWQTVQIPPIYIANQWPIKSSVISPDGRYIAAAGSRGLVHYSLGSGRWKTFDDPASENEFTVRGGMCWYQHILVAAVDADGQHEIRLYSREKSLSTSSMIHQVTMAYPVVHMSVSGADSLLVYTYENVLFHYVFIAGKTSAKLELVGQIGFHGIIRAPARVRSINWLVPDEQRDSGEPSQDVLTASVMFLVDGKLVLLQPSPGADGELKYDMRVIAQDVEHYVLTRELALESADDHEDDHHLLGQSGGHGSLGQSLRDSLWYFDGKAMRAWPDISDVVVSASAELARELPHPVSIPTDFYPLSALISKGILTGLEPEIIQRRDVDFAFCRFQPRIHLFIPPLLRHHLSRYDSTAALHLSDSYQCLPYFAHALEVLLHNVLDEEVDAAPSAGDTSLLSNVLSFLSSFPSYLDVVVGCTRKTELRSWGTLFKYLPPVADLFEEALQRGMLKTAAGFLLVLHTFDEASFNTQQIARLLLAAKQEADWDLCKELARFLLGIDSSGAMLRDALMAADIMPGSRMQRDGWDGTGDESTRGVGGEDAQGRGGGGGMADSRHGSRAEGVPFRVPNQGAGGNAGSGYFDHR